MKDRFVITKNVKRFQAALQRITHDRRGLEHMALVTGEVGLGKTQTVLWYAVQSGAIIIRTWEMMTGHWLLREIVRELGVEPAWRTENLVDQLKEELVSKPRVVILDEIDRFLMSQDAKKLAIIGTLRDVHDVCHCPMVFVGEESLETRMKCLPRFYDRVVEVVKFERLDIEDVGHLVKELSDFQFNEDVIRKIANESGGRIRPIIKLINRFEDAVKSGQLRMIK